MEKILNIQNPHWGNAPYEQISGRFMLDRLLKKLQLKEMQVILGVRRTGKSTLFKLVINHLLKQTDGKEIFYINLDDPFFSEIWDDAKKLYAVIETVEKITGTKIKYLFLDEAQNVDGWEKFVKSCYDSELFAKIFITGSNSSLLKGDYASLLSGRYVEDHAFPLSFQEILAIKDIHSHLDLLNHKAEVISLAEELLFYGGFPQVFKIEDKELKREVLLNYYETILFKDCISNNKIRDTKTMQELSMYLIANNSSLYSYNNLAKALNSNDNTIKEFVGILEGSFLIEEVKGFSYSLKNQAKGKKKCYCIDNGIINTVSFKFSGNQGKLFENLVYTELRKSGYREIYLYHGKKECDFILKKSNHELIPLQVVYNFNHENRAREIAGLTEAMETFGLKKGYIITFNQEETINEQILVIPFWKWWLNLL